MIEPVQTGSNQIIENNWSIKIFGEPPEHKLCFS